MCTGMEELGWEQGVTGGCHPLCVLWHFDSALIWGCRAPTVVTRAPSPGPLHLPCAKANALGQA